jgi:hypothetical protein
MKRAAVLFAAGVATLLLSGPAIAKDPTTGATAPAEKPTLALDRSVGGQRADLLRRVAQLHQHLLAVLAEQGRGRDLRR